MTDVVELLTAVLRATVPARASDAERLDIERTFMVDQLLATHELSLDARGGIVLVVYAAMLRSRCPELCPPTTSAPALRYTLEPL